MNPRSKPTSRRLEWLRFGLVVLALVGVITFVLVTNIEPVEAAPEVTLHSGDQLIVSGEACSLVLINATQSRARMRCDAFTATATATATETATATATATQESGLLEPSDDLDGGFQFTSDVVSAPDAKIRRTIKAGKKLNAQASVECKLKVVEETATAIRIKCKPKPITPTPTATATQRVPTKTNTARPSVSNLYLRNVTGGELCYEVFGTGVGRKCFGGGDSFYGSFQSGTYTYKAEARCGSLTESIYFPPGNLLQGWECQAGITGRMGRMSADGSAPSSFATPAR